MAPFLSIWRRFIFFWMAMRLIQLNIDRKYGSYHTWTPYILLATGNAVNHKHRWDRHQQVFIINFIHAFIYLDKNRSLAVTLARLCLRFGLGGWYLVTLCRLFGLVFFNLERGFLKEISWRTQKDWWMIFICSIVNLKGWLEWIGFGFWFVEV